MERMAPVLRRDPFFFGGCRLSGETGHFSKQVIVAVAVSGPAVVAVAVTAAVAVAVW